MTTDDQPSPPIPPGEYDTAPGVIYAWQMLNADNVWNIVALGTPAGPVLPMVTTNFAVAWEAFDIAQEHANRNSCRVRLASFAFDNVMAIVEPNDG